MKGRRAIAVAVLGLASAGALAQAPVRPNDGRWIATWGSAQMVADGEHRLPPALARDVTLRQVVRASAGGTRVRIRISNAFGTQPLRIGAAHFATAAAPGSARIGTGVPLRFAGRPDAFVPAGAEIYSDPVPFVLRPRADLAISLYLPEAGEPHTGHPGARATAFLKSGNHVADGDLAGAIPTTRWYAIADVEVQAGAPGAGTIVAIGDSITDGYGVAPDTNARWTDTLAERLRADPVLRHVGLVNAGIGGNRVLRDGSGPNLLARFDRDAIARSGVRWVILLEGVNDLGVLTRDRPASADEHRELVADVTGAYRQLAARAHAHGIRVIGGTILPFATNDYYHPGSATEADRQAINRFIRTSGTFDAVIDFDRLMRDPARVDRLSPAYDSGDGLHPSPAGYRAMGEAVPFLLFSAARPRQRSTAALRTGARAFHQSTSRATPRPTAGTPATMTGVAS